jgi:hypothetical protein
LKVRSLRELVTGKTKMCGGRVQYKIVGKETILIVA